MARLLKTGETPSTNSWVKERAALLDAPVLVYTDCQTAGRGQRGNSWESEPGKNLTCSMLLKPEGIEAARQFCISEAVALAVADVLGDMGVPAKVKWPNDIYAGDRKICGILIEHSLLGSRILHSIAGIGLNLNQERFLSDAPNPVSVKQLTGRAIPIEEAAAAVSEAVERRLLQAETEPERLHEEYMARLWRSDGIHPFFDRVRCEPIEASILSIAPDGMMTLVLTGGSHRTYAFKEAEFIL